MVSQRLRGILWLIASISSGGIAFFLVDPIDLAIFIGSAVLAVLLALAVLLRSSPSWVTWSTLLGAAWFLAFGWAIRTKLSLPIEQLLSVVWIFGFGITGAVAAYVRRPRTSPA
jgi:hypothetical protein